MYCFVKGIFTYFKVTIDFQKSQFEGRIKELKEVLTSLHRDLNLDMYKNADKYYIKSFREVEVCIFSI